ncbi:MAG: helix-turn-helix transcriptional regulator [Bacillota bacterium]|nr:helix-turn-helix transcriptional regulator [Bacillota bacterium]
MAADTYIISEPLRYLLGKNKISAYEFSKAIGINRAITSEYLSGKRRATLSRIDLFCNYFGVSREFFTEFDLERIDDEIISNEDDSDLGLFDTLKDSLSEKYSDYQLNKHRKSFEKYFNFYFDTLDTDQKKDILQKMHDVVYDQQQGVAILDFNDSDLSKIADELGKLYMIIYEQNIDMYGNDYGIKKMDQLKIRERITTEYKHAEGSTNNIFEMKQLHIYEKGFEAGLLSSLTDAGFYRYVSINKLMERISEEIDFFSELVLIDIMQVLMDLQKEALYNDGINDINKVINDLGKEDCELGKREVSVLIDKLKMVKDDCLYRPASNLVWDLINEDQMKLIEDLNLLKEMLQKRVDDIKKLANHYNKN